MLLWKIALPWGLPRGKLPHPPPSTPGKVPTHHKNFLENNCTHSRKFPSTSATSELRKTMNWRTLYYNIQVLQLTSYLLQLPYFFLQILTKPSRTLFIRAHLSLNASLFSPVRTQRNAIFWKNWLGKKIQKYFIVNKNMRIIRAWYLRELHGAHTYLPKKTGILLLKIIRN